MKTVELLFLKSTGVYLGEIGDDVDKSKLDLSEFLTRTVELDPSRGDYWYGDYATGEIRSKAEKPLITESYVRYNTNVTVLERYPVHTQINIIIDLLAQSDIQKTPEFVELKNYLDTVRAQYREQKQAYASNPAAYTWISLEEEEEIARKRQTLE